MILSSACAESRYLFLVSQILQQEEFIPQARENMPKTKGLFGTRLEFNDVGESFPLLTTKQMSLKNVAVELLWFLRGDSSIKFMLENNCNIWVDDAYRYHKDMGGILNKEEFVKDINTGLISGNTGMSYPLLWRKFGDEQEGILPKDQIADVLLSLKEAPFSRRHIVTAWNPLTSDKYSVALPPCHNFFQFNCQKDGEEIKLNLQFYMRSVDVGLGLPYNVASYALLLLIFAKQLGYKAGDLVFVGGDTHIYENHIEGLTTQMERTPFYLPKVTINDSIDISTIVSTRNVPVDFFKIEGYQHHPAVKLPLSVGL